MTGGLDSLFDAPHSACHVHLLLPPGERTEGSGVGVFARPSVDVGNLSFEKLPTTAAAAANLNNTKRQYDGPRDSNLTRGLILPKENNFSSKFKDRALDAKDLLDPGGVRGRPVALNFDLELTGHHRVSWEGVLVGTRLFLPITGRQNNVASSSKEAFVALLEYAEEELQCEHIIVTLPKNSSDRASLIKTFMFMGFTVLPPDHPRIRDAKNKENIFLNYEI